MTLREYWRVLGFGAFFTASRAFVDSVEKTIQQTGSWWGKDKVRILELETELRIERQARIELHEKLTDSLMTKAGLQKLNFKPAPKTERPPQPLTALDEMEADYDRVQAEDREATQ